MAATPQRDSFSTVYLQQMQTLAFEMNAAMGAIAGNSIAELEESIAKQEMLCVRLAKMATAVQEELQTSTEQPLPAQMDSEVAMRIQAAGGAIRTLNMQYAALLKHSGRSVALLSALCRNHTGQEFQEACGARLKQQTWSCEM